VEPPPSEGTSRHFVSTASVADEPSGILEASSNYHHSNPMAVSMRSISRRERSEAQLKEERLINWKVEILQQHLRKVIALRSNDNKVATTPLKYSAHDKTPLDEVAEVIYLPKFCEKSFAQADDHKKVKIEQQVVSQLRNYVAIIASYYHNNPTPVTSQ